MEDRIQEKIQEVILKLEKLHDKVNHLEGIVDSERGTIAREHKRIHEEIRELSRELKVLITDIQIEIKGVITHPESGLVIKVDRLIQDKYKRDKERWIIFASIIALAAKAVFDLLIQLKK